MTTDEPSPLHTVPGRLEERRLVALGVQRRIARTLAAYLEARPHLRGDDARAYNRHRVNASRLARRAHTERARERAAR